MLQIPRAGLTTLRELLDLVSQAVQEDAETLVIKAGFPPKAIATDGGPDAIIAGACSCLHGQLHPPTLQLLMSGPFGLHDAASMSCLIIFVILHALLLSPHLSSSFIIFSSSLISSHKLLSTGPP